MSSPSLLRWSGRALVDDDGETADHALEAADSLLVGEGRAFALGMHRARFLEAVTRRGWLRDGLNRRSFDAFWAAAFTTIPSTGNWFPRVELRSHAGTAQLAFRLRRAPELTRAVTLMTHGGPDPRKVPRVKGPDLDALLTARTHAQWRGADDVVMVTNDGYVIDAGANALVWWRDETLCAPPQEDADLDFARVPSITARTLFGLASALGVETRSERATPEELDGTEVWALNALHGIRMVTGWVDGPSLAEKPGRIGVWRDRREVLRTPIGDCAV